MLALIGLKMRLGLDAALIIMNGGSDDGYSWITKDPDKDIFSGVKDTATNVGRSGYQLGLIIAISCLAVSILMAGVGILMSKSGSDRGEGKSKFIRVIIGGSIIFGAMSIIGIIANIGGSI